MSGPDRVVRAKVRVVALGSRTACDDEAGLCAAQGVTQDAQVILAGRPGPGLIDCLEGDGAVVLVDVVEAGLPPGQLVTVPLGALPEAVIGAASVSSHGLGPAEALRLAVALGRTLPRGTFVGMQGQHFQPGQGLSAAVSRGLPAWTEAIRAAVDALAAEEGSPHA